MNKLTMTEFESIIGVEALRKKYMNMINLSDAKVYTEQTHFLRKDSSTFDFMENNEILLPYMTFAHGMGNLNTPIRPAGYVSTNDQLSKNALTVARESFKVEYLRSTSFKISKFVAGQVGFDVNSLINEFRYQWLNDEIDLIRTFKLAKYAENGYSYRNVQLDTPIVETIVLQDWIDGKISFYPALQNIKKELSNNKAEVGGDSVLILNNTANSALTNDKDAIRYIGIENFDGDIKRKVRSIDGVPIVPIRDDNMWTVIKQNTDESWEADKTNGQRILGILISKKAWINALVFWQDIKLFNPQENQQDNGAFYWFIGMTLVEDLFVSRQHTGSIGLILASKVPTPE